MFSFDVKFYECKTTMGIHCSQYHKSGIIYNHSKEALSRDNDKLNCLNKFDFGLIFVNFQKIISNEDRVLLFSILVVRSLF